MLDRAMIPDVNSVRCKEYEPVYNAPALIERCKSQREYPWDGLIFARERAAYRVGQCGTVYVTTTLRRA